MPYPATNIDDAVDLIIADGNKFGEILRGDINTTVVIEGGTVPSVAKALADSAAYKAQIAWDEGVTETDLLQLRELSGIIYAPITVPIDMIAAPNPAEWKVFTGVVGVADAPADTFSYGRDDNLWVKVTEEAPSDGNQYARKDAAWEQVAASGSTLTIDLVQTGDLTSFLAWQVDSSIARTRNLPIAPTDQDEIVIKDFGGLAATNVITIGRNGKTIMGLAEDLVIDENFGSAYLKYESSLTDWRLIL